MTTHRRGRQTHRPQPVVGGLTLTVGALILAVSLLGLLSPAVLAALQRCPGGLGSGQVWRLLSPLLVHDSWMALVGNLVLLVVIGGAAERRLRGRWWLTLFVVGGVTGQLVGPWWQPTGAGSSVAVLGLLGGLALLSLRGDVEESITLALGVVVLMTLVVADVGGGAVTTALVACGAGAAGVTLARWHGRDGVASIPPRTVAGMALAIALALVALRDIHGAATLAGAVATALLVPRPEVGNRWPRQPS